MKHVFMLARACTHTHTLPKGKKIELGPECKTSQLKFTSVKLNCGENTRAALQGYPLTKVYGSRRWPVALQVQSWVD